MKRIITILLVALIPMLAMSQGVMLPRPQKVTTHQNNSGGKKKRNNTGSSNRNNARHTSSQTKPTSPQEVEEAVKPAPQPTPTPQPKPLTGTINGHEWVDLGLSVKWATCNVGANSPSDYGGYYAWGETSTKPEYWESNSVTYKKRKIGDISGNPQYDAARSRWGGTWRLPTKKELEELEEKCRWEWTTQDGHTGYLVTSKTNGKSIFLPAAGWRGCVSSYNVGGCGLYWCSKPFKGNTEEAYYLFFSSSLHYVHWLYRSHGYSVRPVSD